ncbi:MAG: hypothetical protein FJ302_02605 [Planctomycetes bacterium]|nr:hypothetical protein [Planctomycetota bacterium]
MTRRDMAIQASLGLVLVCGVVAANFVLHRWVIGNAGSREVNAETSAVVTPLEDLEEFAPRRPPFGLELADDPARKQDLLRKLIATKFPQASDDERQVWFEELGNVSLPAAEGILDLRLQLFASPSVQEFHQPQPLTAPPVESPNRSIDTLR